jgi:phosphoribosylanthranilate isomerase
MVWIKICGITTRTDAEAVSGMGADSLGLVFSTGSPRRIGMEQAQEIRKGAGGASGTGVFVNEEIRKILECVRELQLDYVQLSGDEEVSYIKELKQVLPEVKVIKALRIKKDNGGDYKNMMDDLLEYADLILLDSYHKDKYGGTGKTIDWSVIKDLVDSKRLIVSGGLDPENVLQALNTLDPFGVDASSRLEASPGKKDLGKVERFIKTVRGFK